MRRLFAALLILLLAWGLYELFLVYPNVARLGSPLQRLQGIKPAAPEHIVLRLVDLPAEEQAPNQAQALKALIEAKRVDQNPDFPLSATLGSGRWRSQNRRVLLATAPAEYSYRLELPEHARLAFGYGLLSDLGGVKRPGVKFQVAAKLDGQEQILWEKEVQPRATPFWEKTKKRMDYYYRVLGVGFGTWGDGWQDASVDLSAFSGRQIELILRAAPLASGPWPAALFSDPVVLAPNAAGDKPPLNVVLFLVDALNRRAVGAYTPATGVTPRMDAFAGNATQLDRYFGVGDSTRLGTFPILTGKHFAAMGLAPKMFYLDPAVRDRFFRQHFSSFATVFRHAGYQTAELGANQFILPTHPTGLDLGFDEVQDFGRKFYRSADTMHAAMEWLGRNSTRPFFLYVHFNAPHASENPSPQYVLRALGQSHGDFRREYLAYLAEVIYSDEAFGQFLQALDQLGIRDRTLVILSADHGQALDPEHFVWTLRENQKPWAADFVHGRTLLAEEIEIPCLLGWPLGGQGRTRVPSPLASVDLLPTVAGLVLPAELRPRAESIDGRDYSGLFQNPNAPGRAVIYTVSQVGESLVVDGQYHYIRRWPEMEDVLLPDDHHRLLRVLSEQLYDLEQDPAEHHNLIASDPARRERMEELLIENRPQEPLLTFLTFHLEPGSVKGSFEIAASDRGALGTEVTLAGLKLPAPLSNGVEPLAGDPAHLRVSFTLNLTQAGQGLILPYSIRNLQLRAADQAVPVWLGPFALRLTGSEASESFKNPRLRAERSPRFYGDPPGAFLFTMKYSNWIQETFSDASLSPAVRQTLKQWGYID